jgi:hypothetical protein
VALPLNGLLLSFLHGRATMILPPHHPLRVQAYSAQYPESFAQTVLAKLSLADAFLGLCSYVLKPTFLNRLFEQHRSRCYEDLITFD